MVLKLDLFLLNKSIPFVKQKEPGTWPFFSSLVQKIALTRIFHESPVATTDMAVLLGVLGCRPLRRTVQVRLGTNPAVPRDELPGGKPIFAVSRQQYIRVDHKSEREILASFSDQVGRRN